MRIIMKHVKTVLVAIMIITLALGWKYTFLGFLMPVVMLTAIIVSRFKGRYHCGNICPRAHFLNSFLGKVSRQVPLPAFFKHQAVRFGMLAFMMTFMAFMISRNVAEPSHWGFVFWQMCVVTTVVAVVLGVLFRPRTWCAFCPMGTMQHLIGNHSEPHLVLKSEACKECFRCESKCPLNLQIIDPVDKNVVQERDCLRCSVCVAACPARALTTRSGNAA